MERSLPDIGNKVSYEKISHNSGFADDSLGVALETKSFTWRMDGWMG